MKLRPLPQDPDGDVIEAMVDLNGEEWLMTAAGDYQTAAVEGFKNDGSGFTRLVVVEWPGRLNKSDEERTVRLAMAPEDALGLAQVLTHSARFLQALPE
jgi:hypothetical protein